MSRFWAGVLITIAVICIGGYIYLSGGYIDFRADQKPSATEDHVAMSFLDASTDRHAPKQHNPVAPSEANLTEGAKLYKTNCAMCHGAPHHPELKFGHPFYPPAPQFMEEPADMPEYQNFYIIKHGVRWTGMPAWGSTLSDGQIWTLVSFLSHMKELPPAAEQEWQAPPPAGPAKPPVTAPPAPAAPKAPAKPIKTVTPIAPQN